MVSGQESEDDTVSVTSSIRSEQQDEYEIVRVLGEDVNEKGITVYLVEWEGYPLERCSWEPAAQFTSSESIDQWNVVKQGPRPADYPDEKEVRHRIEAYEQGIRDRKARRARKRERLGLSLTKNKKGSLRSHTKGISKGVRKQSSKGHKRLDQHQPVAEPPKEQVNLHLRDHDSARMQNSQLPLSAEVPLAAADDPTEGERRSVDLPRIKARSNESFHDPTGRPGNALEASTTGPRRPSHSRAPADWVGDFVNTRRRKDTGKEGDFNHMPSKSRKGTENAPDIDSLNLRPAEEWTTPKMTFPQSYSSNTEATIETALSERALQRRHNEQNEYCEPQPSAVESSACSMPRPATEASASVVDTDRHNPQSSTILPVTSSTRCSTDDMLETGKHKRPKFNDQNMKVARNGRWCSWGQIIVTLAIGPIRVGDARFEGFEDIEWFFRSLSHVKAQKEPQLKVDFHTLLRKDQFEKIYQGKSIRTHEVGWVTGYDDTTANVKATADNLEKDHNIAVWNHPERDMSLFACSVRSGEWAFLRQGLPIRYPGAALLIILTMYLPLPEVIPPSTIRPIRDPEGGDPPSGDPQSGVEPTRNMAPPDPRGRPPPPRPLNTQQRRDFSVDDYRSYFSEKYGLSFEDLVSASKTIAKENLLVFLRFSSNDESQDHDLKRWKRFFKAHGIVANSIYDSNEKLTWQAWCRSLKNTKQSCGIIITDESRNADFSDLSHLHEVLRHPRFYNMFESSLSKITLSEGERPLQPLFPSGAVVLLTESSIRCFPEFALAIIRWFTELADTRPKGTWKLFMRPNIGEWLRTTADEYLRENLRENNEAQVKAFQDVSLEIHMMLYKQGDMTSPLLRGGYAGSGTPIQVVSPDIVPKYGEPSTRESVTQETRDEHSMIEYFAAWATVNCRSFRRFFAITPLSLKDWLEFSHVHIIKPEKFCEENRIKCSGQSMQSSKEKTFNDTPGDGGLPKDVQMSGT